MNSKLEKFLDLKKKEELNKRNDHLRLLGLTDDTKKVMPIYSKQEFTGSKYDEVAKKYYTNKAAIEVTDAEYAEICKYDSKPQSTLEKNENTIKKIMVLFTWLWGIGALLWIIILLSGM